MNTANPSITARRRQARKQALQAYYAQEGAMPSLATLTEIWGYASKSTSLREIGVLAQEGFIAYLAQGKLRPGPGFFAEPTDENAGPDPASRNLTATDGMDAVATIWTRLYGREAARNYVLISRLLRLTHCIETAIADSAADLGLNLGEFLVLDALYRLGPPYQCSPTELGKQFLISLAGIGKRVDRLTELGFVERARSANDRRTLLVRLTQPGLDLVADRLEVDRQARHFQWISALSSEDYARVTRVLRDAERFILQAE